MSVFSDTRPTLQNDCILYHLWAVAKFYIFTVRFKFLHKQTPDDDWLDRNM
jgi:hypothetical protein